MVEHGTVHTAMNVMDLGVLVVLGLSGLMSFFRGFIRELLSLGAWVGSSIITLYTFPHVTEMIEPQIHNKGAAGGIAALGVFIVSLVVISIFTGILVKFLKPSKEIGVLDNIIGLGFGITRGALVIAVAYYSMSLLMKEDDYPEWVKTSVSQPYVAKLANWLAAVAPDYLGAPPLQKTIDTKSIKGDEKSLDLPTLKELQNRMQQENEK